MFTKATITAGPILMLMCMGSIASSFHQLDQQRPADLISKPYINSEFDRPADMPLKVTCQDGDTCQSEMAAKATDSPEEA